MTQWGRASRLSIVHVTAIAVQALCLGLAISQSAHAMTRGLAAMNLIAITLVVVMRPGARYRLAALLLIAALSGAIVATTLSAQEHARPDLLALSLALALSLSSLERLTRAGILIGLSALIPVITAAMMQGEWAWVLALTGASWVGFVTTADLRQPPAQRLGDSAISAVPSPASESANLVSSIESARREAILAREQAEHALAAARLAVLDKTRFLAAASHDLRQPVHAIGLFVGALKEEIREGRGRYLVERLERSMAGLDELFNRLLDISRLDAGSIEPRLSVLPIVPLLQTLDSRFSPLAQQRQLRFRVHLPRPCAVSSDPALLVEMLMNLLSNAFRYTERGGILLGTRRRGGQLVIQIWDTGIGIAPDQIEAIFGEFVQLGNSSRDRRQGLGLGLSIVRRLASSLAVTVHVRSRPQRGSVFEISVPLSNEPLPTEAAITPADDASQLQGLLILAVDDELDILIGMEALLVSWGCFVILARSVSEARRHLGNSERFPDLLITDHRLSDHSTGSDVIDAVREQVPIPVPVIVVTGEASALLQDLADRSGWALLPKPVNPDRLRRLIIDLTRPA